jgi:hypothetical protein
MSPPSKKKLTAGVLMLAPNGKPLAGVSPKKAEWYLSRDLAREIEGRTCGRFDRCIQLTFKPKKDFCDQIHRIQPIPPRCVVCGSGDELTTHHVVPYVIRRALPEREKSHTNQWCVLLCEEHHRQIERSHIDIYKRELTKVMSMSTGWSAPRRSCLKEIWATCFIERHGGLMLVKNLFRETLMALKPKFIPTGFVPKDEKQGRPD